MNSDQLAREYRAAFCNSEAWFSSGRALRGPELMPLLRQQAAVVNPIAESWGYRPPLRIYDSWYMSVEATQNARASLCAAWDPSRASLLTALRWAARVDWSVCSAVESLETNWDAISPPFPDREPDVDEVVEFLADAYRERGADLLAADWQRECLAEPTREPTLLAAALMASWLLEHRRDLMPVVRERGSAPLQTQALGEYHLETEEWASAPLVPPASSEGSAPPHPGGACL